MGLVVTTSNNIFLDPLLWASAICFQVVYLPRCPIAFKPECQTHQFFQTHLYLIQWYELKIEL